jgi:hypothetical protein
MAQLQVNDITEVVSADEDAAPKQLPRRTAPRQTRPNPFHREGPAQDTTLDSTDSLR